MMLNPVDLVVRSLEPALEAEWNAYVYEHPLGSPFHLTHWRDVVAEVFHYQPLYLLALEQGRVAGLLPLFLVQNLLMGRVLLSTPFAVYGGVLASHEEAKRALVGRACELAEQLRTQYLELRNASDDQLNGFHLVRRYATFQRELPSDESAILQSIPRKTRYMIRKALRHPYETRVTASLDGFFDLYSRNLRRLGTPCFPRRYFEILQQRFGPALEIREVLLQGRPVAVVMSFYFRDRVLPYYGASDPAYWEYAPNDYMYFDLMRAAAARGIRIFDFGRSKLGTGSFAFKAHWGMECKELPYEVRLVRRKTLPNYTPLNPRYQWAVRLWRRLPLSLTRWIGPHLIRLVP